MIKLWQTSQYHPNIAPFISNPHRKGKHAHIIAYQQGATYNREIAKKFERKSNKGGTSSVASYQPGWFDGRNFIRPSSNVYKRIFITSKQKI